MKKKYCLIISLFMLCLPIVSAQTTEGKEFWLAFGTSQNTMTYNEELQIRIVNSEQPTLVKIHFTNLGSSSDIVHNMVPYEIFTYMLDYTQKEAVLNKITGITDYSIRITSFNAPVSVYALRIRLTIPYRILDATNVLPVTALGTEYYQISYISVYSTNSCTYLAVATQSGTNVYHNGVSIGPPLQAGQVYYKTSTPDMTGDYITADKPIAFFSNNNTAYVPPSAPGGGGSMLLQQLAPVNTWGKTFFVPVSNAPSDIVRIVASQDSTTIKQTGGTMLYPEGGQTGYTIDAGQFIELAVPLSCYIQANKPIGVCTYLSALGTIISPAQCWLPPIEQTNLSVLMAPFISDIYFGLNEHYALVVTSSSNKIDTKVSINGLPLVPLNGGNWIDDDTANMSYYTMPLTNITAPYLFNNPKGLFVLGYGRGIAGNSHESYYYLAGSAMRELDAAFYANAVHFQDLKDTTFCAGFVSFQAELENMGVDMDSLKWYINGIEETAKRDSLEWSKTFAAGEYEITMWVRFENDSTVSKTGTLKIMSCNQSAAFYVNNVHYESLQDTVFCDKNVHFNAEAAGLHPDPERIKWFINGVEHLPARDQLQWSMQFETGEYDITMWARYEDNETVEIERTLKMKVFWVKIRNVRY